MTAVEWLKNELWEKFNFSFSDNIFEQASLMEYKQNMNAMQRGMELQKKENNRIGFRERNGLLSSKTEISDEEIEKEANNLFAGDLMWSERIAFKVAIKWYREQLKSR